jgi:hypothetical protein
MSRHSSVIWAARGSTLSGGSTLRHHLQTYPRRWCGRSIKLTSHLNLALSLWSSTKHRPILIYFTLRILIWRLLNPLIFVRSVYSGEHVKLCEIG